MRRRSGAAGALIGGLMGFCGCADSPPDGTQGSETVAAAQPSSLAEEEKGPRGSDESRGSPTSTEAAGTTAGTILGDPGLEVRLAAGEAIYFRGEIDSARAIWSSALEEARVTGNLVTQARALTWLGLAAWREGTYREARRLGEEALALKLQHGFTADLFKSYNALGLLAWNEGRLSEAVALFQKASEAARSAQDSKGLAAASANLALVQTELGQFAEARRGFVSAREAARTLEDARIEGNALTNLGMLDIRIGDPGSAIHSLREARRLYRSVDYPTGEQNALGQLGTAYAALGEPQRALAALDSALSLSREQGLRQEEASNLEALAGLFREAGDFGRALKLYAEAKRINEELGLDLETGSDLRSEAEILVSFGDLDEARSRTLEALRVHRAAGARFEELVDLLMLAELAGRMQQAADVAGRLGEARRLAEALEVPLPRLLVSLAEARLAERVGNFRRMLEVLRPVDADFVPGGYGSEWEVHALRARAHAHLGALDSAAASARLAVAAVERVRGNIGSGLLRTTYLADKAEAYASLVTILLRLGRTDEAFEYADAARGRALREQLAAARRSVPLNATTHSLVEADELLREAGELTLRLAEVDVAASGEDSESAVSRRDIAAKLREARAEFEALLARTARMAGAEAALLGGRRIGAREVRESLAPGEALLEYLSTPDRLLLFAVTRQGIQLFETEVSNSNLASRVRLANGILAHPGRARDERPEVLAELYDALLGPATRSGALMGARRLLIVPHGALGYLPFAALRDDLTGRFLAQNYAILYLPSAAALPLLREGARARGGFTPPRAPATADVFAPLTQLLPATRREAEAIGRSLRKSRLHLGARATERGLRQALAGSGLVHVATHGVMNARNPMFSRIELAPGLPGETEGDGRLEVHELLGLSLESPLVFLSGCETGLGNAWSTEFARGEDYATLAQAFLYAGVQNVVATLWRVEDDGAAAFAERFYRRLGRGVAPAEALASAQRDLIRDSRYGAPYYWAAYALSGTGELREGQRLERVSPPHLGAQNLAMASVQ